MPSLRGRYDLNDRFGEAAVRRWRPTCMAGMGRSLHPASMGTARATRTCATAAIADAVSARRPDALTAGAQPVSPARSFKAMMTHTSLSAVSRLGARAAICGCRAASGPRGARLGLFSAVAMCPRSGAGLGPNIPQYPSVGAQNKISPASSCDMLILSILSKPPRSKSMNNAPP